MSTQKLLSALALDERCVSVSAGEAAWNGSLARRRLSRWKKTPPFDREGMLEQRLRAAGLDQRQFLLLLGQDPAKPVATRDRPRWLLRLEQDLGANRGLRFIDRFLPREHGPLHLCRAFAPWIARGYRELIETLEDLQRLSLGPAWDPRHVADGLISPLLGRIGWIAGRTLVLEMHVAGLEGRLAGSTPPERFENWLTQLERPEAIREILEQYPLLGRRVVEEVERWRESSRRLMRDLCRDWTAILEIIPGARGAGRLERIATGQGDLHEGGRSVAILEFDGGFRLVYKPRSLEVDHLFADLLATIGKSAGMLISRPVAIHRAGDHGWQEFVPRRPCRDRGEVRTFYQRLGGLLAALEIFGATDLHHENLIADGPFPVPIDLETLFQPPVPDHRSDAEIDRRLAEQASRSVLRVGLLPDAEADEALGLDLSGIGAEEGQEGKVMVPEWTAAGTDGMRLGSRPARIEAAAHRPRLDGDCPSPLDFAGELAEGFEQVYRTILSSRKELLAPDGILAGFDQAEIRVLVRNTAVYELLLDRSHHPHSLRHGLERERVLDGLWMEVRQRPKLENFAGSERRDLLEGDVPVFRTSVGSTKLRGGGGELGEILVESGLERSRHRIAGLGEEDLERQLWLIRAAMTSLVGEDDTERGLDSLPPVRVGAEEGGDALAAALALGQRLARQAARGGGRANWVGLVFSPRGRWSVAPLGGGLYDGIDGIVLFLAYLAEMSGEAVMRELAECALRTVLDDPVQDDDSLGLGAFDGRCSRLYMLTHLAALWQREDLAERARRIVDSLEGLVAADEDYDVISGSAGALVVLDGVWQSLGIEHARKLSIACGHRLLEAARREGAGLTWPSRGTDASRGMTGFAHGLAGIAWALAHLHRTTGEETFAAAARAALIHERRLLAEQETSGTGRRNAFGAVSAWCHGSPGVGLGRSGCFGLGDDDAVEADLRRTVEDTLAHGFSGGQCLCHGSMGNLELLERAALGLGDRRLENLARSRSQAIVDSVVDRGAVCGTPSGVETPTLMTGLAGIGLGLLRRVAPDRIPSPLLLDPPGRAVRRFARRA